MNKEKVKNIIEWVICIFFALIIAILFRYFIATPTIVSGNSMNFTLIDKEKLIINRTFRITKNMPKRGDIVTLEAPSTTVLDQSQLQKSVLAKYENDPTNFLQKFSYYLLEMKKTSYIKRVIGMPNDHVVIKNGKVYINDSEFNEPYLQSGIITDSENGHCTDLVVPENSFFVMGDNRPQSTDSRYFGCVPLNKIEGIVIFRIYPLNKFNKF